MARLFFIRVGGTAMGGVAAACAERGDEVFGSEQDLYEPMKGYLEGSGVHVFPTFDPSNVEACNPDLIVVGNAVSRGNPELEAALEARRELISLPELIGRRLIERNASVVIAGTHGKTTTSAMTANMLDSGGLKPGFMIGGVPGNFDVSCRPCGANPGIFVIEGDEYDSAYFDKRSKFLHYRPTIAVLHNIEFDHADIFANLEEVKRSFRLFMRLTPRNGLVLANGDDENVRSLLPDACSPVQTYGFGDDCDWRIKMHAVDESGSQFSLWNGSRLFGEFAIPISGEIYALNMTVAIITGHWFGLRISSLQAGAKSFRSPKRRMEEIGKYRGALVIDDFGHHPTAIAKTLSAIRAKYPGRRILAAFEPRSNTTVQNIYQQELTDAFELAGGVFLGALDRPWRFDQENRLKTQQIAEFYRSLGRPAFAIEPDQGDRKDWGHDIQWALDEVVHPNDVIVLFSNGNFGQLRQLLTAGQAAT